MKKCIVLIFLCSYYNIYSFNLNDSIYYGGEILINNNISVVDFKGMPKYGNCCSGFENAYSFGLSPGIFIGKNIIDQHSIELHLGYRDYSAEFEKTDFIGNAVDANNQLHRINVKNSITTNVKAVSLDFVYDYELPMLPISLNILGGIDYVYQNSFSQKEEILNNNFEFINSNNSRNVRSGDIQEVNKLLYNIGVGGDYQYRIDKEIVVSCGLNFKLNLNSLLQNQSWNMHSIGIVFKIKYMPTVIDPPPPDFTFVKSSYKIIYDNSEKDRIILKQYSSIQTLFIPNVIEYNRNESIIPYDFEKYENNMTPFFNESTLDNSNYSKIYENTLNIIAKRMQINRKANLTLSYYLQTEDDDRGIGRQRIDKLKAYFIKTWGIAPNRIKVKSINSNGPRSVAISSDEPNILAPIVYTNNTYCETNAKKIIITIETDTICEYTNWKEIKYNTYPKNGGGYVLNTKSNVELPYQQIFEFSEYPDLIPGIEIDYIDYWFQVDQYNKKKRSNKQIKTKPVKIKTEISQGSKYVMEFLFTENTIDEFYAHYNSKPDIRNNCTKAIIECNNANLANNIINTLAFPNTEIKQNSNSDLSDINGINVILFFGAIIK